MDSICSVPKPNFYFFIEKFFSKTCVSLSFLPYPISKVFSRLSIRYKSTYRILVLVINDRNEILTSRPLQQTNHSRKKFSLYLNITSFFSYYDWNKKNFEIEMINKKFLWNSERAKNIFFYRIIILTISKNCSYYERSIMAVGQVCPHRLVVQDISLSRRQRGFDFPWG